MRAILFSFLKKTVLVCGLIFILSTIGWDLGRSDNGYIRPIFFYFLGLFLSVRAEVIEICDTPLASLTIAKIFKLIWYIVIGWFLIGFGYIIWSIIRDLLRGYREKEIERKGIHQEEDEDAKFSVESSEECAEFVSVMRSSKNQSELDFLLFQAIEKWPKWERQLSNVYEERKKWIKKNTHD